MTDVKIDGAVTATADLSLVAPSSIKGTIKNLQLSVKAHAKAKEKVWPHPSASCDVTATSKDSSVQSAEPCSPCISMHRPRHLLVRDRLPSHYPLRPPLMASSRSLSLTAVHLSMWMSMLEVTYVSLRLLNHPAAATQYSQSSTVTTVIPHDCYVWCMSF